MSKDPGTSRIPRLGTSHIRPPSNNVRLRATKIFRPTGITEPTSSGMKRSNSGEKTVLSKGTQRYFGQSKLKLNSTPANNVTQVINRTTNLGRTRPVIPEGDLEGTLTDKNVTQIMATDLGRMRTFIKDADVTLTRSEETPQNLTHILDKGNVTKSMDQLPLIENMCMPTGTSTTPIELPETEFNNMLDVTLTALAPNKTNMKLALNSTLNTERLLDISGLQPSPARHIQLLNLTREFMEASLTSQRGGTRRSIPQNTLICLSPKSASSTPHGFRGQETPVPVHLLSPLLKQAQSDLVLPTRTPDGEQLMEGSINYGRVARNRHSFGLNLTDSTLDCSIELVENSYSSSQQQLMQLRKEHSFDLDESLGILTPEQMKEFLDSPHNNRNLQMRLEQTPSPEELPLDPIEIKSEIVSKVEQNQALTLSQAQAKLSNSFITSVTSVTSLDTGYQGDGEMSRPASRGACDHSPSNGPQLGRVSREPSFPPPLNNPAPLRRQDPMTDSDFFTESDADDVLQRGDRRAQVIDGQLYGPDMLQPRASVPQMEDSCMESSGIFTDVENRCDEEIRQPELEMDMSPDESTQTMRKAAGAVAVTGQGQRPPSSCLSSSSAGGTTLSNRTSYCSVDGGSTKSFCDEAFAVAEQRSSLLSVQHVASPRPHASLSSLCTTVETPAVSPKSCIARKSHTPNKWDAVMNKIAINKPLVKTNYNDVKSKVSSTRANMATTSTSTVTTPRASPKATLSVKRSTSTKPSPPVSTRQPQDKGSVGISGGRGVAGTRLVKSPTTPTSPPAKRLQTTLIKRGRSYSKDSQKSSHSDLSLLCNGSGSVASAQAAASVSGSGSPKLLAKTQLRSAKKRDVRNLSISPTDLGPPPKTQQTAKGQSTRNKSSTPTPTTIPKRLNGTPSPKGATAKATITTTTTTTKLNKSTAAVKNNTTLGICEESLRSGVDQSELQEITNGQTKQNGCPTPSTPRDAKRSSISNELSCICSADMGQQCQCHTKASETPMEAQQLLNDETQIKVENTIFTSTNESPVICDSTTSSAEIAAQYPALKPYISNGIVDFANMAKFFESNTFERREEHRQIMGLAVMVQFMSEELDAFACRETKEQCAQAKSTLEETIERLHQTEECCKELRQELHNKDVEWAQREQEREHLQRAELKQAQDKLLEVQMLAQERYSEFESQLLAKEEECKRTQQAYHLEVNHKLSLKQEQLTAAEQTIVEMQSRIHKLETQEQEQREKLLRKENIQATRLAHANQREQELSEQVKSLTEQLMSLRASKEHNERDLRDRLALSQDEISVLRSSSQRRCLSTSLPSDTSAELCRLTSEADSLRSVLELKQAEISVLSKTNADLRRENDDRLKLSNRVALLEAQSEMLRTELDIKTEREKSMQLEIEELKKDRDHVSKKCTRLSCDQEMLQYRLMQCSLQKQKCVCSHDYSNGSPDSSLNCSTQSRRSAPPPTSPVIKGVIKRADSVSWTVLDEDALPKVSASKMVRRAGSLRGSNERRQLSVSCSSASTSTNGSNGGPNPLSQSLSATMVPSRRSHPHSTASECPLSRARSHSVCTKDDTNGEGPAQPLTLPVWHDESLLSSSPQPEMMRPRCSTMKLISCDAKALKKFQEIQESAGEAMVSGANSEDESCSASSEEMMRSSSASSTNSNGAAKQPPSRMSIEEALPCTPMEVSWSEDAADAAEAEAVQA